MNLDVRYFNFYKRNKINELINNKNKLNHFLAATTSALTQI